MLSWQRNTQHFWFPYLLVIASPSQLKHFFCTRDETFPHMFETLKILIPCLTATFSYIFRFDVIHFIHFVYFFLSLNKTALRNFTPKKTTLQNFTLSASKILKVTCNPEKKGPPPHVKGVGGLFPNLVLGGFFGWILCEGVFL